MYCMRSVIVIMMLKYCIECDLFEKCYFTKNLLYIIVYISLPLFVYLCVCCMCDDRMMCVLYGSN